MSGKHILAFEADPLYANMLSEALGTQGFEVEIVSDGVEGLDKAAESSPDLIYLCVELPRVSGFSICNKLKKSPEAKDIPLVITSSEATEDTFEKHKRLKVRADEYVHKPFDADQIVAIVNKLVGEHEGEHEGEGEEAMEIDDDAEIVSAEELEELGDIEEIEELEALEEMPAEEDLQAEEPEAEEAETEAVETEAEETEAEETEAAETEAVETEAIEAEKDNKKKRGASKKKGRTSVPPAPTGENVDEAWAEMVAENRSLSQEKDHLQRKLETMEKELISMKATTKSGVTSSEFLDLREALNKKDRELLDLRDELHNKEKELLDYREKVIGLERQRADLEDKNIDASKTINKIEGKLEVMTVERNTLASTCNEHADTIADLNDQVAGLESEIEEEKNGRADDIAALKKQHEEAMHTLEESLRKEAADQHDADEKAKAEALEELKTALSNEKEGALTALKAEHAAEKSQMEEAHAAKVAELEGVIETEKGNVAKLEEEKAATTQERDELRSELESTQAKLKETEETLASTEQTLGKTQQTLGKTQGELAEAQEQNEQKDQAIAERDGQIELLSKDLDELGELAAGNEEMVEKAKKALAIATQLLDELEPVAVDEEEEDTEEEEDDEAAEG